MLPLKICFCEEILCVARDALRGDPEQNIGICFKIILPFLGE
jgi:hypothetical protein